MPAAPRTGCGRVGVPQAMFGKHSITILLVCRSRSPCSIPLRTLRSTRARPSSARTRPIDTAVQLAPGVPLEVLASHNDRSIVRATQRYVACGHGSRLPRLTDLRPGSRRRDDRGPTASSVSSQDLNPQQATQPHQRPSCTPPT
ncbi:hypothetical protein AURDEDRAFT_112328 [Auricularia subglabra TFB-10046 SS5]|nr:hypothetical protein AURDEDRAFT_112328 [Auricularia subglabra TFB-10046 SS5]